MHIGECGVSKGHNAGYDPPGMQVRNKSGKLAVAGMHGMEYPVAIVLGEEAERGKRGGGRGRGRRRKWGREGKS